MEASTCLEKMVGNSSVGVVLKDVSLEVHGGELMAVLGSKGILSYENYYFGQILCGVAGLSYKTTDVSV